MGAGRYSVGTKVAVSLSANSRIMVVGVPMIFAASEEKPQWVLVEMNVSLTKLEGSSAILDASVSLARCHPVGSQAGTYVKDDPGSAVPRSDGFNPYLNQSPGTVDDTLRDWYMPAGGALMVQYPFGREPCGGAPSAGNSALAIIVSSDATALACDCRARLVVEQYQRGGG